MRKLRCLLGKHYIEFDEGKGDWYCKFCLKRFDWDSLQRSAKHPQVSA